MASDNGGSVERVKLGKKGWMDVPAEGPASEAADAAPKVAHRSRPKAKAKPKRKARG